MALFKYIARSRTGERIEGTVDAADKRAALVQIERMGQVPVSVAEGGAAAPSPGRTAVKAKPEPRAKRSAEGDRRKERGGDKKPKGAFVQAWRKRKPRLKPREVLLLTRELSDLLASGMTLGNALHTLSRRKTNKEQDNIIEGLRDEIVRGMSLSDALAARPESFPSLYVSMVRAGEASGQLSEILQRLANHYERMFQAREKVMMALMYPAIIMTMGFATILFCMIFVVPRFMSIFEQLGSELPLLTRILISFSNGLLKYGWMFALLGFAGITLFRKYTRTPGGRRWWHGVQLRMPVMKLVIRANAFANFARTLSTLLANGVQVLPALSIVENTVSNVVIAEAIRDARERVTDGATISKPLSVGGIFPPLLTDMLAVGEESGDLNGALSHIAKRYEEELDRSVKIMTTVLEPIMMLFMAVVVGFIAISMLLAVFDLTSGLNV